MGFIDFIKGSASSDAKDLKRMREERLKLEGRVKLQKAIASEQSRIKKAKSDIRANSKVGRFVKLVKDEAKEYKKSKGKGKDSNPWRS